MALKKGAAASEQSRRANTVIRKRVMVLSIIFGIATFLVLFIKLWSIQIVNHDLYKEKAIANQTRDLTVSANRGKITDSKGTNLAISATVHNVVLSPKDIIKNKYDQELIATGLAGILGIDAQKLRDVMQKADRQYEVVATKVEEDVSEQVRQFIVDNELGIGIYLEADSKRYYPYSTLAAQVIGFVGADNGGSYGLEALYNGQLAGEKGRIVTSRAANGVEMLSSYEAYIDASNGNNLTLTIDATIQSYAEKAVQTGIERFDVLEGGVCIVMNPKTAAIYAIVSFPNYDLNDHNAIKDPGMVAKLTEMKAKADEAAAKVKAQAEAAANATTATQANPNAQTDPNAQTNTTEKPVTEEEAKALMDEYLLALGDAQETQWRSKAVVDAYEPGSTFKPVVVSMALEEGVIKPEDTFACGGSIRVPGWPKPINCHQRGGHGMQDVEHVLMNSCNPAMIQIGQKIGNQTFYEYIEDYGYLKKTGVDLQGEGAGYFWPKDSFLAGDGDLVSLATASFGQRFQITPIQVITAMSAVINGGHLMEPYVVQTVTDSDGNVIKNREPKEVRQVISQETSDLVRSMMTSVVMNKSGSGKNAQVDGYVIGGKTGTSETQGSDKTGRLITSFVGFAPADDPEIIVLMAFDHPRQAYLGSNYTPAHQYISGGNMAAPMAGQLMADILEYLGVEKQGGEATRDVSVPNVKGKTLEEAQNTLKNAKNGALSWKVIGSGGTVTDQTPRSGTAIPAGSTVVLYMGEEKSTSKVAVPNVEGRTYAQAKKMLESCGLYIKSPQVDNSSKVLAFSQSVAAGTEVALGTVVEVRFTDNSVRDYA